MIAHLDDGAGVLRPEPAALMQSRVFGHDVRVNGYGLGFFEMSRKRTTIVGHGGSTRLFHSLVALFPDHELGLFVSYNSDGAFDGHNAVSSELLRDFSDYFFPAPPSEHGDPGRGTAHAVAGSYASLKAHRSSHLRVFELMRAAYVIAVDDHTIDVFTGLDTVRLRQVEPFVFGSDDGELVVFRTDDDERVTHAFDDADPTQAYEKLEWSRSPLVHGLAMGVGLLALVTRRLVASVASVAWLVRGRRQAEMPHPARIARRVLAGAAWVGQPVAPPCRLDRPGRLYGRNGGGSRRHLADHPKRDRGTGSR